MTAAPATKPSTWQLLVRDVTDESPAFLCLVLDAAQGQIRAIGAGESVSEARVLGLASAATAPAAPFEPGLPDLVVCLPGDGAAVRADVASALSGLGTGLPGVVEEAASPAVEAFLDDLMAHLQGPVPENLPSDEEWAFLVARTLEYARAQPWLSWPDDLQLRADLTVDGEAESYVLAVIGHEGLQAGLVLYPGRRHSDVIVPDDDWQPTDPLPFRPGSLLLHLNPPDDTVEEMAQTAVEFGWPADSALMPVWISAGPDGFADLDRFQAARLSLAVAAVLARVQRPLSAPASGIEGTLSLAGGGEGHYTVEDLPRLDLRRLGES